MTSGLDTTRYHFISPAASDPCYSLSVKSFKENGASQVTSHLLKLVPLQYHRYNEVSFTPFQRVVAFVDREANLDQVEKMAESPHEKDCFAKQPHQFIHNSMPASHP
jgi:hypothetical protein